MPSQMFTTVRTTVPDRVALAAAVVSALGDATALVEAMPDRTTFWVTRTAVWNQADITSVQSLIDTTPIVTPQQNAQRDVDGWPIELRALVLALIDQLNIIRAALPTPLGAITPAQALAAIRAKAGTL